jgi:hypothetical protein
MLNGFKKIFYAHRDTYNGGRKHYRLKFINYKHYKNISEFTKNWMDHHAPYTSHK